MRNTWKTDKAECILLTAWLLYTLLECSLALILLIEDSSAFSSAMNLSPAASQVNLFNPVDVLGLIAC